DYEQRAAHYWPLEVREVKTERVAEAVPPNAVTVACDVDGRSLDSASFAAWLDDLRVAAHDVAFLTGGADGRPAALRGAAGPRATCVLGVGARIEGDPAGLGFGPVELVLEAAGRRAVVRAEANPFFDPTGGVVVRRSDLRGADTLAIDADTTAADLDRSLVAAL